MTAINRFLQQIASSRAANYVARVFRYSATSIICFGISEAVILILTALNLFGATTDALIANFAGVIPSYILSRYWIWKDADRQNTKKQIILYWLISLVSIGITSFATGFITHHSDTTGDQHIEVVGGSFLILNFILWIVKYIAYNKVVFKVLPESADSKTDGQHALIDLGNPSDIVITNSTVK